MVQYFKLIIILLWTLFSVKQILLILYWLQTKEYRWDRFLVLLSRKTGLSSLRIAHWLLTSILLIVSLNIQSQYLFPFLMCVFIFLNTIVFVEFIQRKLRKPKITSRMILILLIQCLYLGSIVLFSFENFHNALIFGQLGIIVIPFFAVFVTWPLSIYMKNKLINKAKKIMKKTNAVVIGVTGSYGKTTTKEFIAQILSKHGETVKTFANENTEIGVAKAVIKSIRNNTKYFVVEMGAYKKGEIKAICDIVKPTIGVITGIEPQHLALFGSIENIEKAKYELIESLPDTGIALFNYSNSRCVKLGEKTKNDKKTLKVLGYSLKETQKSNDSDIVSVIKSKKDNEITFEVSIEEKRKNFTASFSMINLIENLTAAILVARCLNLDWNDISQGMKNVELPKGNMKVEKFIKGVVVDDSYNSSPKSFESAIDYLDSYKNKTKLLITPGIIELGSESKKIHFDLGQKMKGRVQKIIVTDKDNFQSLSLGYDNKGAITYSKDSKQINQEIKSTLSSEGMVLLEGRVPVFIRKYLDNINI